jgi:hypothetical protein
MSIGGVFQLITNDGLQDKLIMDTDRLRKRMKNIQKGKLRALAMEYPNKSQCEILAMKTDWSPTLAMIEQTHHVFVNASFKPFVAMAREYSKTPPRQGTPKLGNTFSFTLPIYGEFINDCAMYIKLTGFSAVSPLDKVRYVELPGHRIMKKVRFKVQNHVFDEYGPDEMNVNYQWKVPIEKQEGYHRCIGQETPKLGYLTADPTNDEVREYRWFGNGPQTFKRTQDTLEMWIPIMFWFRDIQSALPNFILPANQVDIEVELEDEANMISFANYGGGGSYNVPVVSSCYLYANHIFLLPEIHNIFMNHFGVQLIRVHRKHTKILTGGDGSVLLNNIKWPIECLYIAFRPTANLSHSRKWHRNTDITDTDVVEAVVTGVSTIQVNNATYLTELDPVASLELRAHDTIIYPSTDPLLYSSYLPFRYGAHLKTPKDLGWYMMNFNFNPGTYQPSGHFNVSKARELYLHYTTALNGTTEIIRTGNPVELIVIADAINFLLYSNGNVSLRFAT